MPKIPVTVSVKSSHECKSPKLKPPQRRGLPLRWSTIGRISGLEETAPPLKGLKFKRFKAGELGSLLAALFWGGRQKRPGEFNFETV